MQSLGIAIWIVTGDKKTLLLPPEKKTEIGRKSIIYQPMKSWVDKEERVRSAVFRKLLGELGRQLAKICFQRIFQNDSLLPGRTNIEKKEFEKENFRTTKGNIAARWHFLCEITEEELALFLKLNKFIVISKKDLAKIKQSRERGKADIILYSGDYEFLTEKIWNLQTTLA